MRDRGERGRAVGVGGIVEVSSRPRVGRIVAGLVAASNDQEGSFYSSTDNYRIAGKSRTVDVHRTVHKATIRPGSAPFYQYSFPALTLSLIML